MNEPYDDCSCADLAARLRTPNLLCLARVTSTLDVVHELAAEDAPGGTTVLADEQTRGRGREGRAWHSPKGVGIWIGYLVRPVRGGVSGVLALRVGMAAAQAVRGLSVEARVKWPNDLLVGDRKLGGILCEARGGWVAVGLGMNVHGPLPGALRTSATVLDEHRPGVTRVAVLEALVPRLHGLPRGPELNDAERRLFAELDWLRDRALVQPIAGTARGITADGALLVETERGTTRLTAGSVRAAEG